MAEREEVNKKKEKAALRKRILSDRNALLPKQREIWDKQILEHLIRYDGINPCSVYMCYVNYKSEVSTKDFILWCLEEGKTVFIPKVFAGKSSASENRYHFVKKPEVKLADYLKAETTPTEMDFYQITAWDDLREGYQGILEPEALPERAFTEWLTKTEKEAEGKPERIYLRMLLPGTAFDKAGNRMGYGGGFYDRWIAKQETAYANNDRKLEKIGLAYCMQIVETLPAESFDQKVDLVLTEEVMV